MLNKGNNTRREGLNERQKRFVEYYLQTGNLSESARKAGYAKSNCGATGNELLKNPKIQTALNTRLGVVGKVE